MQKTHSHLTPARGVTAEAVTLGLGLLLSLGLAACDSPGTANPVTDTAIQTDNGSAADTPSGDADGGPTCTNACDQSGARQCEGNAVVTCADHDGDGCLEWGGAEDCGAATCDGGYCALQCDGACTVKGATRCQDNAVETCDDVDGDGCLEWGAGTPCQGGTVCSNGFCAVSCSDECTVKGARQCSGSNGVQTCADYDFDGCLQWGDVEPCPDGQVCVNGSCATECSDACTVAGAKQCSGTGAWQECGDYNGDGCLEWGTAVGCQPDEVCSNGNCATTCTSECSVLGATKCNGDAVQTCDDTNGDGCLEWGTAVPCDAGQQCSGGFCSTTCTNECSVEGAKQCDGGGVKTCGDGDGDGCLEWGTVVPCDAGQTCSNGNCAATCADDCTVTGAKQCDGNGVKTCGNFDADSCLEWGTVVPCDAGQTCSNGNCAVDCTDECTSVGAKRCDSGGVQTCGNFDADSCLEWGSVVPCDPGETCSDGNCALTCTNTCQTQGAQQCNVAGTAYQVCDDANGDGCLEWGSEVPCAGTDVCSAGVCGATCTSTCPSDGAVQCNVAGSGVETCSDYNGDGCLEWGTAAPCGVTATCDAGACVDVAPPAAVVINELLYDDAGTDVNAFIELYGEPGLDLTGFVLAGVNGANGQDYNTIDLSGQALGADGFFVVADDGSDDAGILAEADLLVPNADMQNGPDSVVLRWGTQVVDGVGYGDFAGATFAGEGNPAVDVPSGQTLGRDAQSTDTDDNAADFHGFTVWTPGAPNGAGNQPPVAALTCGAGAKTGQAVSFDASGSTDDGAIADYRFDFGDGVIQSGTAAVVSHAYTAPGTFTVEVTVTDDQGATGVASCQVSISDALAPTVVFVKPVEDIQVTQGSVVQVTVDVTPAAGRSVTQTELVIDGAPTGDVDDTVPYEFTYTVPASAATDSTIALQVRATDDQGAVGASVTRQLSVKNDAPVASFSAIISGNLEVTVDASGSTDTETPTADLEVRWDWDNDGTWDTGWSTAKSQTHVYASDGAYTIACEVRDNVGQTATATREVNFQSVLDVSGTITTTLWYGTVNVTGDVVVPAGETLTIAPGTTVVVVEVDQGGDGYGDYGFQVYGALVVNGTADAPVIFTVLPTIGAKDANSWDGLHLAGDGSALTHAVVEYATAGVDVTGATTLEQVELRYNEVGLEVGAGGNATSPAGLWVHDSASDGVRVLAGGTADLVGPVLENNGGSGLMADSAGQLTLATCNVSNNALDGLRLVDSTVDMDGCAVTDNGEVGVNLLGSTTGTVTHNQIKYNGYEGVRALIDGTGKPVVYANYNNILGNATAGNLVLEDIFLIASSGYNSTTDANSPSWTTPNGAAILAVEYTYSETSSTSSLTGVFQTAAGGAITSVTSNGSGWRGIANATTSSIRAYVDDNTSYGSATLKLSRVAYVAASEGRQVAAVAGGGGLDARFNYLGVWPDVLSAVRFSEPSELNLQGFVGQAFDATWDTGIYRGGQPIETDTTWDTDFYVTGDILLAPGVTLTLGPGITVRFVPTDQDADGVGDWKLDRVKGSLVVNGTAAAPVTFTTLGTAPAGGGFQGVVALASGAGGTTTMTYATLDGGANGYRATAGTTTLDHVTVTGAAGDGIVVTSNEATLTANALTVTDNGGWGLQVAASQQAHSVTNSTMTGNAAGAVRITDATLDLTQSNLKFNGYGVVVRGQSDVTIQSSDILYNDREGLFVASKGSSSPAVVATGNNIFGNAAVEALYLETPSGISASSGYNSTSDPSSDNWSPANGAPALYAKATYSETSSTSSLSGAIQTDAGVTLITIATTSSEWYDVSGAAPTGLSVFVNDNTSYGSASISLDSVLSLQTVVDFPRQTEMSVVLNSGTVDATGNYWGTFPDVASRVLEAESGMADYSGFKSTQVSGTGPQ